ncbi:aldose 1-epimerase family protein [Asticcacaulis sp. EMRT-3]|uniref:aldose 1-epimerase family protein n=1 Tax=Asticcacaulis sp. EMRT-3 TaxID=3040349 RepID=UPI0024AED372|nr:aldose 1-epimerase family protein [Asticcacaulis sp. EMRT-3]MDI7773973.1 aldose 1-epimerase family protein [Asticcacaulis sp. EMRT-3]
MTGLTRIANSYLTLDIAALGAEMQSLTSADGRSWLWDGDPAWWSGRAPILFPMVGKAPDDKISLDGQTYAMGQHGFARRSLFGLATAEAAMCRFELMDSDATRASYPFAFRLAITYALKGRTLIVTAEVENRDARPMPFGFGFHPAFLWPLPGADGCAHTIQLDNGAEPALVRLKDGLIDPHKLPSPFDAGRLTLDPAQFAADAMIFLQGAGTGLTYSAQGGAAQGGPALKFTFENLPNLALWQKPGAPYICIEPWHGTAAEWGGSNDLAQRPYSLILAPGGTARFALTVEVPA